MCCDATRKRRYTSGSTQDHRLSKRPLHEGHISFGSHLTTNADGNGGLLFAPTSSSGMPENVGYAQPALPLLEIGPPPQIDDETFDSSLQFCADGRSPQLLDMDWGYADPVTSHPARSHVKQESNGAPQEATDQNYICFGTVCDVKVQLRWTPMNERLSTWDSYFCLKFDFRDGHCVLQTETFEDVALLNQRNFHCFSSLLSDRSVNFKGIILNIQWNAKVDSLKHGSNPILLEIDANIYGYSEDSDAVARRLARAGLFLQPPRFDPDQRPYFNPQYFDLSDLSVAGSTTSPDLGMLCTESPADPLEGSYDVLDFDAILDAMPKHDYLSQVAVGPIVLTPLLVHQSEALDFVQRRESGFPGSTPCLWQLCQESVGQVYYQHIITGAKSPTPDDMLGGILADDMGLGKSLTMLAAITASYGTHLLGNTACDSKTTRSTLIVVPSTLLLDVWEEEIAKHIVSGTISYARYHGHARRKQFDELLSHDITLTTYGTITADYSRGYTLLDDVFWHRIILDEAHVIRNQASKTFKAVNALSARIRWCLTGTPIQNSLQDFAALIRFLSVPLLEDPSTFRRHIEQCGEPQRTSPPVNLTNLRFLLGSICLRRSKDILQPYRTATEIHMLDFNAEEYRGYKWLENDCKRALTQAMQGNNPQRTHQSVLETLLRLRLYCNNGPSHHSHSTSYGQEDSLGMLQQMEDTFCAYCSCDIPYFDQSDSRTPIVLTPCRRLVCTECHDRYRHEVKVDRSGSVFRCPLCQADHKALDSQPLQSNNVVQTLRGGPDVFPTKLCALLDDIRQHSQRRKSVVFSSWKSTLDIVGKLLQRNNISYLRIDGSLSTSKRKQALWEFQSNNSIRVLIMTLGTGSMGLNGLCVAERLYILEPQWNPSVESQAMGRVMRLGQTQPVTIVKYIMNSTVEKNIQSRQQRKISLAKRGFNDQVDQQQDHWKQMMYQLFSSSHA